MATHTIWIDKNNPKKNGTCSIYIKITHERKSRAYRTNVCMKVEDFESRNTSKKKEIRI